MSTYTNDNAAPVRTSAAERLRDLPTQPPRIPACHWYLLAPLAFLAATLLVHHQSTRQASERAGFVAVLDAEHLLASRVGAYAAEAASGAAAAFVELRKLDTQIASARNAAHAAFARAGETRNDALRRSAEGLEKEWAEARLGIDKIAELEASANALRGDAERLARIAAGLLVKSDVLVDAMIDSGSEPDQLRAAERQLLLIQRIETNVRRVLEGGDNVLAATDRFGRDVVLFGDVNAGLKNGSETLGLARIAEPTARAHLETVASDYRQLAAVTHNLMNHATAASELRLAAQIVARSSEAIAQHIAAAKRAYAGESVAADAALAQWLALATLLSLLLVAVVMARNTRAARIKARQHSSELVEAVEQRQQALEAREERVDSEIQHMMSDLERLADMDWARELPPVLAASQDAQASWAMHGAMDNVRRRVQAVSNKAVDIRSAVLTLRDSSMDLRGASQRQGEQFEEAAASATKMSASFKALSNEADRHAEVSRACLRHLKDVAACVTDSAGSLDAVVESVKQTSNGVRGVAESSQQVHELKDFIDDLSEQSKMLSLNVAIQSPADSEVGQALADYSQDVQRLAERAKFATRRIERVNEAMQEQLDEALGAIKQGLWKAGLAADRMRGTRRKLPEIRDVTTRLGALDQTLADAYREHTLQMSQVVKLMSEAARQGGDVRQGLRKTVRAAGDLADLTTMLDHDAMASRSLPEHIRPDTPDTVIDMQAERGGAGDGDKEGSSDGGLRAFSTSA